MVGSINEYQQKAWETALETAKNPAYMVANLTSEAGEVAGKYAKWIRDVAEACKTVIATLCPSLMEAYKEI